MTRKESLLPSLGFWSKPAIKRFRSDLDSLFDEFFTGNWSWDVVNFETTQPKASFPKVNVSETDSTYQVEIAVAGFGKEDVNLELKDNTLTISAEKKEESESEDKSYLRKEISSRSFSRSVRFPVKIDENKATAEYKDGIIQFVVDKEQDLKNNDGVTIEVK